MKVDKTAKKTNVINREAGDKTKGFRFQKLRAAIRFLQRADANRDGQVLCAMELLEDSVIFDSTGNALVSGEENKLYTSGLSFNSAAIRNTLVAFLDLYFAYSQSPELKLGVFASADVAQERVSGELLQAFGLEKKQKQYGILKKLIEGESLTAEEQTVTRAIATKEYAEQYKGAEKGFSAMVNAMSDADFQKFLRSIEWSVSSETNDELENEALAQITGCRFYSYRHERLEATILAVLLNELEKRSGKVGVMDRLLTTDTLKLIFQETLLDIPQSERPFDPAAEDWEGLEATDLRNLAEKLLAICPDMPASVIGTLARRCSLARKVEPGGEREMKGLLRRVLDVCENDLLKKTLPATMSRDDVLQIIDDLTTTVEQHYASLRQSYRYKSRDHATLKGAVLSLFDDCYLALDQQ